MEDIFEETQKGFSIGYKPKLTEDGSNFFFFIFLISSFWNLFFKKFKGTKYRNNKYKFIIF